jgi:hypothetical protein
MAASRRTGKPAPASKYAAKTPEARARQLANLTPRAAIRHGAYSAEKLAPERERILGELLVSFPGVRRDRLELAAAQRARIVLLQAYVDERGLITHRGRGESPPAVAMLRQEEAAYRVELSKIEDLACDADTNGGAMGDELTAARAALAARSGGVS